MGDELARAFCKHDRECAIEAPETALLREETCFSDSRENKPISSRTSAAPKVVPQQAMA